MLKCPVCPISDIPDEAQQCEGCGTDLSPIQRVRELAKAQFNAAVSLAEMGDMEEATNRILAALAIDERLVEGRRLAGKLLWQCGRREEAVQQWRKALAFAPQDQEIVEMLAVAHREKSEARRRWAVPVFVAFVVVVLCAFSMYAPLRAVGRRLDRLEEETVAGRAYCETHSRPDTDYVALQADLGRAGRRAESLSREFSLYRAAHGHPDTVYVELVERTATIQEQAEAVSAALAAQQDLSGQMAAQEKALGGRLDAQAEALRGRLDALGERQTAMASALASAVKAGDERSAVMAAQYRSILEASLPALESLVPGDVEALTAEVQSLRTEKERLREETSEYRSRQLTWSEQQRKWYVSQRLTYVERRLTYLEPQYEARVVPWDRLRQVLQSLSNAPQGGSSADNNADRSLTGVPEGTP